MTDFFVSYNQTDEKWAEWLAYVLEEEEYTTSIQAWDFRPGSNFVLEMQRVTTVAKQTIMVLSPDYLISQFASSEWAAAFVQDPQGFRLKLVPVIVRPCAPTGLLLSIVQIRLVGCDEHAARRRLLDGVQGLRIKPSACPAFPGQPLPTVKKVFPGASADQGAQASRLGGGVLPPLKKIHTDIDKRRFVKESFERIKELFQANLTSAEAESRVDTEFQLVNATDFQAEIFVDGRSICTCHIWKGGMHSDDSICYSEGRGMPSNSYNDVLTLAADWEGLFFRALMPPMGPQRDVSFNHERLSVGEVPQYLWHRFVARLHT